MADNHTPVAGELLPIEPVDPNLTRPFERKSALRLEEGKYYRNGWGNVCGPMQKRSPEQDVSWWDSFGHTWTVDGTSAVNIDGYDSPEHQRLDLIEEVTPTRIPSAIVDGPIEGMEAVWQLLSKNAGTMEATRNRLAWAGMSSFELDEAIKETRLTLTSTPGGAK